MKKALLVDDSKSARMIISRMLKKTNLDVTIAENGYEAIKITTQYKPDVIFMDYMMPGINGIETMEKIHDQDGNSNIPIVMCTGNENDDEIELFKTAGAVAVLAKPPGMEAIKNIITSVEEHLSNYSIAEDPSITTTIPIKDAPTFQEETMIAPSLGESSLRDILGRDNRAAKENTISNESIQQMVLSLVNSQVEIVLKQKIDALEKEMTGFRDDMTSEAKKVARTEARISASQSVDSALASTVDKRIEDKTQELDEKFSMVQENMHEEAGEVARSEAGSLVAQLIKTVLPEAVSKKMKTLNLELDKKLEAHHHQLIKHTNAMAKEESIKTAKLTGKQIEQNLNGNLNKVSGQITHRLDKISTKLGQQTEEMARKTEQKVVLEITEQTDHKIDELRRFMLQQVYFYSGVGALTGATIAFLVVIFLS